MNASSTLAAAVLAAALFPAGEAAPAESGRGTDEKRTVVEVDIQALRNAAQARQFLREVEAAATEVCSRSDDRGALVQAKSDRERCRRQAYAEVVRAVNERLAVDLETVAGASPGIAALP